MANTFFINRRQTGCSIAGPATLAVAAGVILTNLALATEAHPAACAHATTHSETELLKAPKPGAARHKPDLPAGSHLNLRSCQYRVESADGPRFYCKLFKTPGALKKLKGPVFAAREALGQPAPTARCRHTFRDPYLVWQRRRISTAKSAAVAEQATRSRENTTALEQQLLAHIVCADIGRSKTLIDTWAAQQWQQLAARLSAGGSHSLFDGQTRAAFRAAIMQRIDRAYEYLRSRYCATTAPAIAAPNQARQKNAR